MGVYHSIIIYAFGFLIWYRNPVLFSSGKTVSLYCFGSFLMQSAVSIVNLKLLLETVYKTYYYIGIIVLSILSFVVTTVIYNLFAL
jgi:phospholipid-translocating ATPase